MSSLIQPIYLRFAFVIQNCSDIQLRVYLTTIQGKRNLYLNNNRSKNGASNTRKVVNFVKFAKYLRLGQSHASWERKVDIDRIVTGWELAIRTCPGYQFWIRWGQKSASKKNPIFMKISYNGIPAKNPKQKSTFEELVKLTILASEVMGGIHNISIFSSMGIGPCIFHISSHPID